MEQNMLPLLWQPLSTVALIRAVMEMVRREEYREAEGPDVESARGRAEGFSSAHRVCDGQLMGPMKRSMTFRWLFYICRP